MDSIANFLSLPFPTVFIMGILILTLSAFLRVSIIFSILFYGLGLNSVGGRITSIAISLTLSFFLIQSDLEKSFNIAAFQSSTSNNNAESISRFASEWKKQISTKIPEETKENFKILAQKQNNDQTIEKESWQILAPAYVITEFKSALSAGFKIILPFLLIDLIIAYLFTALDIRSLNATTLSFPLKILAFISVDGITLLTNNIMNSYISQ